MGAELGRLRRGEPTETGMSEEQLRDFARRHRRRARHKKRRLQRRRRRWFALRHECAALCLRERRTRWLGENGVVGVAGSASPGSIVR